MDLRIVDRSDLDDLAAPLLAVPVARGAEAGTVVMPELPSALSDLLRDVGDDVRAKEGARLVVHADPAVARRVVFVGLGKPSDELDAEVLRRFAGHAVRAAEELRVASVALLLPGSPAAATAARAAAEGATLAAWRFRELKTGAGEDEAPAAVTELVLVPGADADDDEVREGARVGRIVAEAENVARLLQSRPGNVATPAHLGDEARRLGGEHGFEVDVLGPERLLAERMHALLAVSRGSDEEPCLIVMSHRGGTADDRPLVLVGKGLTFDAGGISIKPASGMEDMKYDMSGGAAVIGAMTAIARLEIPRNVIGIVPSSENLLSGGAMKPGDVLTTRSGQTVEVVNTDAEGRLILCDALDYALELEPEAMVDCATLTGAVVIALGHHAMAVLGNDDDLIEELRRAGDRSGERCWPLPLWREYRKQLDSVIADFMNVGGRPGGTITAAMFLSQFVGEVPWGHLDIAGTAYGDGGAISYRRKGGYGVPTRLLVEWVRGRSR
jgi:leucyl aminopeptidase